MGIIDRLGNVIRSYFNDGDPGPSVGSSGEGARSSRYVDPDLDAAYDELDDFLRGGKRPGTYGEKPPFGHGPGSNGGSGTAGGTVNPPPESLRVDFAELGLPLGASEEECKIAYKRLLKLHHPDRHAGHEGNMKKATEKSARINAAFDRIEKWRKSGVP
jgi:DnaJ-domain-containing protein 1